MALIQCVPNPVVHERAWNPFEERGKSSTNPLRQKQKAERMKGGEGGGKERGGGGGGGRQREERGREALDK